MKTKKATHTPGPWTNNDPYDSIRGADGEVVCHTFGSVDPVDRLNAILIAAAPEMLEALIETRDLMSRLGSPTMDGYAKVDAAIAKATGKEEGQC